MVLPMQRPTWLPSYLPELDGLRGLAILAVVLYHCHPRLVGTWMHYASLWGWAGVILFFVLSGFLITSILLATRDKPRYFHNFHARRALRIWPVYVLLLVVVYLNAPWFIGPQRVGGDQDRAVAGLHFFRAEPVSPRAAAGHWPHVGAGHRGAVLLCVGAAGALSAAGRGCWLTLLAGVLAGSPLVRHANLHWLTPTHTLIHLDGIALGQSAGDRAAHAAARAGAAWLWMGLGGFVLGIAAAATVAGGTAFLDSALAVGFAGAVLALIASTGARNPLNAALRSGPLAFYGRISYGLYMTHISVFIYFGWFDARMDPYGMAGNLAVVAFRLAATTAVATALWYGFESQILKLKRYF